MIGVSLRTPSVAARMERAQERVRALFAVAVARDGVVDNILVG